MRSLKEIMLEMGFNKSAPVDTQKAFFRHLTAAANQVKAPPPQPLDAGENKNKSLSQKSHEPSAQLEFDLGTGKRVS